MILSPSYVLFRVFPGVSIKLTTDATRFTWWWRLREGLRLHRKLTFDVIGTVRSLTSNGWCDATLLLLLLMLLACWLVCIRIQNPECFVWGGKNLAYYPSTGNSSSGVPPATVHLVIDRYWSMDCRGCSPGCRPCVRGAACRLRSRALACPPGSISTNRCKWEKRWKNWLES